MTAAQAKGKQPAELTDGDILVELRAIARRRVSLQAANATATEAAYGALEYDSRKQVEEGLRKRFPTKPVPQPIPPEPHKKNKDATRKGQKRVN